MAPALPMFHADEVPAFRPLDGDDYDSMNRWMRETLIPFLVSKVAEAAGKEPDEGSDPRCRGALPGVFSVLLASTDRDGTGPKVWPIHSAPPEPLYQFLWGVFNATGNSIGGDLRRYGEVQRLFSQQFEAAWSIAVTCSWLIHDADTLSKEETARLLAASPDSAEPDPRWTMSLVITAETNGFGGLYAMPILADGKVGEIEESWEDGTTGRPYSGPLLNLHGGTPIGKAATS